MNRWTVLYASMFVLVLLALGCSGGGSPVTPGNDLTERQVNDGANTHTNLWGYWDIMIDIETQTVEAVPNRGVMFTANVVSFVNKPATNLAFIIHGTPVMAEWIDVDIDVGITHPFPGVTQYNGYDVRGVFIGRGSGTMMYDGDLNHALLGAEDHVMYDYDLGDDPDQGYPDPYDGLVGMPDGYTRWWNPIEFPIGGSPLGYTQGALANPIDLPLLTATLNPYKYFADGLGVEDNLWEWLEANNANDYFDQGLFGAGETNTRNYYLRFPNVVGVTYGYAITADWRNELDTDPPPLESHMVEAPAITVTYNGDVYFVDAAINGGNFIADVSVWSWDHQPSQVLIETSVHSAVVPFDDTNITGGTDNWSTWHTEIAVDNVLSDQGQEYWVICEYSGFTYKAKYTEYSPPGTYPEALLAAFFRYELDVLPVMPCDGPVITDVAPDTVTQGSFPTITATGTDFLDGTMLNAWLTMGGQADIVCDAATWVDATQCDFDFTIPDTTELGEWSFNMTHDECTSITTVINAVEVVIPQNDIVTFDTGPIGAGAIVMTPGDATYDEAIDLGISPDDAEIYLAWCTGSHGYCDIGYTDRYSSDGTTLLLHDINWQYQQQDEVIYQRGQVWLDVGYVSGMEGYQTVADNIHYSNDENGSQTNQSYGYWGFGYGYAAQSVGATMCGADGQVYGWNHGATSTARVRWPVGGGGNWWQIASSEIGYTYLGSDFDGSMAGKVKGVAMGDNRDTTFWSVTTDTPHLKRYSNWRQSAFAGSGDFGAEGSADGEVSGPVDITIRMTDNRIYVLDSPTSNMFRIQAFYTDGTWLATSGELDGTDYGGADPYNIDFGETNDLIYVLYSNNTIQTFTDLTL